MHATTFRPRHRLLVVLVAIFFAVVALAIGVLSYVVPRGIQSLNMFVGGALTAVSIGAAMPVNMALDVAASDPQVVAHLGVPLELVDVQHVEALDDEPTSAIRYECTVAGPLGKAQMFVVAEPRETGWQLKSVELRSLDARFSELQLIDAEAPVQLEPAAEP